MDVLGRYNALVDKHAELDRQIAAETALPRPDQETINSLKKRKLMMKDEIQTLQNQLPQAERPSAAAC